MTEADPDSLPHCPGLRRSPGRLQPSRNHPASDVDESSEAGAALIAFIWHRRVGVYDLDETRRLIEDVFPTESPSPPLD